MSTILNATNIMHQLTAHSRLLCPAVHCFALLSSTQTWLTDYARRGAPSGTCCCAEYQYAGRGQYGRRWLSPFGSQVALSVLWQTPYSPAQCTGLSLIIGAAVATALTECGASSIWLKWPNDIHWQQRKLGGILIETLPRQSGVTPLIIGMGINYHLTAAQLETVTQPWVDLTTVMRGQPPERNTLAAAVLAQVLTSCHEFDIHGTTPGLTRWQQFDGYAGASATLTLGERVINGQYVGIDAQGGGCLLDATGQRQCYCSGTLRFALNDHCSSVSTTHSA